MSTKLNLAASIAFAWNSLTVDQYAARKKNPDLGQPSLFETSHQPHLKDLGAGRWITIGSDKNESGSHGGHAVYIGDDGKMKTGKFAGKSMAEAFGAPKPKGKRLAKRGGKHEQGQPGLFETEAQPTLPGVGPGNFIDQGKLRALGKEAKEKEPKPGLIPGSTSVKNEDAKAGDQLGLFGEGEKAKPKPWKPTLLDTKGKAGTLFDTKGDKDQMLAFDVDGVTPEDRLQKPQTSEKKPDQAVVNVPLSKRGNIDNQIDNFKADQAAEAKQKRSEAFQEKKVDKARARELFGQHADALAESTAAKHGKSKAEVKKYIDGLVKWQPKKAISLLEGFEKQQAAKPAAADKPAEASDEPNENHTPRQAAAAEQKQLDADYEFARASSVGNVGEDLKGSARHRVNAWRGLAEAEKDGTAEKMVTRDQLAKLEPHNLISLADKNPLTSLAMNFAMRAFPAKPGSHSRRSSGDAAKNRQEYLDAYRSVKEKAGQLAGEHGDANSLTAVKSLQAHVGTLIDNLRSQERKDEHGNRLGRDRFNATANDLVKLHNALSTGFGATKTGVIGRLNEFSKAVQDKYGSSFSELSKSGSLEDKKTAIQRAAEHAKDIMEGASLNKSFGKVSKAAKRFSAADRYVKQATRKGGRDVSAVTSDPNKATKHLVDSFGMRGVQWGNTVTDDERKHHAGRVVEAMTDLADTVGLHPKDIALDGKLGLAIGARGKGTASAHYEPGSQVINLTRAKGVGTLAHEWGHAFDHMLEGFGEGNFGTKYMSELHENTHEVTGKDGHTWGIPESHREPMARDGRTIKERPMIGVRKAYAEWKKASRGFQDRMKDELKSMVKGGEISEKKAGEYWNSGREVFARSFEQHVQHKLREDDRDNTYLTGLSQGGGLWPTAEESKAMAPAFDKIFEEYRKHKHGSAEKVKFSQREADEHFRPLLVKRPTDVSTIVDRYWNTIRNDDLYLAPESPVVDRYDWNSAQHPRNPAGSPQGSGGEFKNVRGQGIDFKAAFKGARPGDALADQTFSRLKEGKSLSTQGMFEQMATAGVKRGVIQSKEQMRELAQAAGTSAQAGTDYLNGLLKQQIASQWGGNKPAAPQPSIKRELAHRPRINSSHALHHSQLGKQMSQKLLGWNSRMQELLKPMDKMPPTVTKMSGEEQEEAGWAKVDKNKVRELLEEMNQMDRDAKAKGVPLSDYINANGLIPEKLAVRLDGGSRFFNPELLGSKIRDGHREPAEQPSEQQSPERAEPQQPAQEERAQPAPKSIPSGLSKVGDNKLNGIVNEVVGDGDPSKKAHFRQVALEAWKSIRSDAEGHNTAVREIMGQFTKAGHGGIAAAIKKGADPTKIRGFDEMVDYAAREFPSIVANAASDSEAGSAEDGLIKALSKGIQPIPQPWDDEVIDRAIAMVGPAFFEEYQPEPANQEDFEPIPFSVRADRARVVARYWLTGEVAPDHYANRSMDIAKPTEAQKLAGNYKMAHVRIHGLDITIETPKGRSRRDGWPKLSCDYGYFKRTLGRDGDHVDVFVGPDKANEMVYVIDQPNGRGGFDEHKVLIGFRSQKAAVAAYRDCYTSGWIVGKVTAMTIEQFKAWLAKGNQGKPIARQVSRYREQSSLLERYAKKDDLGEGRWITVGGDAGADGKKHGGHPVKIGKSGEIQAGMGGRFNGKTMAEAFGGKHSPTHQPAANKNLIDSALAAQAINNPKTLIISRSFSIKKDSFKQYLKLDPSTGEFVAAWPVDEVPPKEIASKAVGASGLKGDDRKAYMKAMKSIPKDGFSSFGIDEAIKIKMADTFGDMPDGHVIHNAMDAEPTRELSEDELFNRLPTSIHSDVNEYAAIITSESRQTAIDDVDSFLGREFLGSRKGSKHSIGGRPSTNVAYKENELKSLGVGTLVAVRAGSQRNASTSIYRKLSGDKWGLIANAHGHINDVLERIAKRIA